MSKRKIKIKKIVDKFKCLQCDCNFTRTRKPGPYYGLGWDQDGKPTTKEQDNDYDPHSTIQNKYWFPKEPVYPPNALCPKCGHGYYKKLN